VCVYGHLLQWAFARLGDLIEADGSALRILGEDQLDERHDANLLLQEDLIRAQRGVGAGLCLADGLVDGQVALVEAVEQLRDPLLGCAGELGQHRMLQQLTEVVYALAKDGRQTHFRRQLYLALRREAVQRRVSEVQQGILEVFRRGALGLVELHASQVQVRLDHRVHDSWVGLYQPS
jgi:hypothetical protein